MKCKSILSQCYIAGTTVAWGLEVSVFILQTWTSHMPPPSIWTQDLLWIKTTGPGGWPSRSLPGLNIWSFASQVTVLRALPPPCRDAFCRKHAHGPPYTSDWLHMCGVNKKHMGMNHRLEFQICRKHGNDSSSAFCHEVSGCVCLYIWK